MQEVSEITYTAKEVMAMLLEKHPGYQDSNMADIPDIRIYKVVRSHEGNDQVAKVAENKPKNVGPITFELLCDGVERVSVEAAEWLRENRDRVNEGDVARAATLDQAMDLAFEWLNTPQGFPYWSDICCKLLRLEEAE